MLGSSSIAPKNVSFFQPSLLDLHKTDLNTIIAVFRLLSRYHLKKLGKVDNVVEAMV